MTVRIRDTRSGKVHPGCGAVLYLGLLAVLCALLPLTWRS